MPSPTAVCSGLQTWMSRHFVREKCDVSENVMEADIGWKMLATTVLVGLRQKWEEAYLKTAIYNKSHAGIKPNSSISLKCSLAFYHWATRCLKTKPKPRTHKLATERPAVPTNHYVILTVISLQRQRGTTELQFNGRPTICNQKINRQIITVSRF